MNFIETRGNDGIKPASVPFSEAITSPSASFNGLYVPESIPAISNDFLTRHVTSTYQELAREILELFAIDIDPSIISEALATYNDFDDPTNPVPVVKLDGNLYVSELYHGPTRAFKDMALQPFGTLFSKIAQQQNQRYLILAATSGDTGPAALKTFENKPNIQVACLYPDGGTSDVQRLQMVTMDAANLKVIGVHGNFDDTQATLKELLASPTFKEKLQAQGINVSAANSVNFGRIIFQIIYHFWSYIQLLKKGVIASTQKVNIIVPSGNFGNALGGYYAKQMGLPLHTIMISSNANNILTDLITTGRYDLRDRKLIQTLSPAMDILISSNVERIVYDKLGAARCKELMDHLKEHTFFELTPTELELFKQDFVASFCTDNEGIDMITWAFEKGYVMDPHTATGLKTYNDKGDKSIPTILYSTAEWTKFSPTMAKALGNPLAFDQEALQFVKEKANTPIPTSIETLFDNTICHTTVINPSHIEETIVEFLSPKGA